MQNFYLRLKKVESDPVIAWASCNVMFEIILITILLINLYSDAYNKY